MKKRKVTSLIEEAFRGHSYEAYRYEIGEIGSENGNISPNFSKRKSFSVNLQRDVKMYNGECWFKIEGSDLPHNEDQWFLLVKGGII